MGKRFSFLFLIVLYSSTCIADAANVTIPNVIVKAPRKINHSLTSGPKTIITREQISASGVTTLSQALQNLGGVQLQDTAGNGSQIALSMRGFGANASSNTLLLVNGIPITNPDLAPPDLNVIPVNEVEWVEIIAGSESVLYGDQAVGGIINVITREHLNEKIGLSCSAGSYNQHSCLATIHRRYAKADMNLTIEKNQTDNYRDHNNANQDILLGGIRYRYRTGHLKFNYLITRENMQYPGALSSSQVEANRRQSTNDTDFFKDLSGFFHLQHQQDLNSNWQLETDLAVRRMNGNGVFTSPFTQSRSSYFIKPQLSGKLANSTITTGMDGQADDYELSSAFGLTNDYLQKYGLFALVNTLINPRLAISLGARGAQQNNQLTSFSTLHTINRAMATTLGMVYQLTPESKLYLRRAGSFRFPKADENASTPPGVNGLRTQHGAAFETGAEINREQYFGKLGLFLLKLKDEITFDPLQTPQQPFGVNTNLAPTTRKGMTIAGKYQVHNKVSFDAQYNFVHAYFQSGANKGKRIPLVSENIIRGGIDWNIIQHWKVYSEAIYTGSQFAASDDANVAGKAGGYTTYNINLRYEYRYFTAALHINNIFNKNYYFYTVYQPTIPSEFFYPAPGRNFTLTLNYAFV